MRILLAVVFTIALLGVARAQSSETLVTANDRDAVLNAAKGFGSAQFGTSDNGTVYIVGRIDGIGYHVFFNDCDEQRTKCGAIGLRAGFPGDGVTLEKINEWNTTKIFGRAYLYNGNARVQMDVNLDYGVATRNLDDTFAIWKLVMALFAQHIGFKN